MHTLAWTFFFQFSVPVVYCFAKISNVLSKNQRKGLNYVYDYEFLWVHFSYFKFSSAVKCQKSIIWICNIIRIPCVSNLIYFYAIKILQFWSKLNKLQVLRHCGRWSEKFKRLLIFFDMKFCFHAIQKF